MTISPTPILDDAAVRVAVRARPLLERELLENCQECVMYSADRSEVTVGKERRFTFDHVFGPHVGQEEVYMACVKPLVESCIAGYNATVLAYGQTGSGKTHTMGSANSNFLEEHELGILPRVIRQLYKSIEEQNRAEFLVKCSFVEIHNEEIKDLLHPETPSKSIFIREDANGDIVLAGVREEVVTSFEDMMKFLDLGSTYRTTGSTLMNQHSSRSHAIFTIIVEQRSVEESSDIDVITAKFHLVDLAGSERAKRTGAVGVRFKESITINSGLLALGNVISALGDERKRGQHVPYRQSKLTRLLQDSLGGNSRTCMIACISLADINQEETLNTLKYANRARNIHNKPIINRDSRALQMNQLRLQLKNLQEELINMRLREKDDECALDCFRSRGDDSSSTDLVNIQGRISQKPHQDDLHFSQDLRDSKALISKLKEQLGVLQNENTVYQEKLEEISTDMNLLLRMIPSWETMKEIAESPIMFLLAMAKRILAGIKEGEIDLEGCNMETDSNIDILRNTQQKLELTCLPPLGKESSLLNGQDKENAFAGTTHLPTDVIRHYLKGIQGLEKKLANKDQELREKNRIVNEVQDDLARDEKIFAEKMREINALKLLTRELTVEKDCLLQKVQMDATIISDLSRNALAKEDELSRLRASIDSSHMQPQEKDRSAHKDNVLISSKNGHCQLCAIFNAFEDHQNHQERDDGELGEIQKAQDEVDTSRELRPVIDKTNRKLPVNFEKRFQDLAYNILKGGKFIQTACANEPLAVDKVPKTTTKEVEVEVHCKDMHDLNCSNINKEDNISQKELCSFFCENQELFQRPTAGVVTEDIYCGTGSVDFLPNEEGCQRNLEIMKQDFNDVGTKDMYLEKKLREITLAWHAEKQAMEEMVQAERETWEARAMYALRKQEQLERDHQALKEELENTKSLMQKAGLGIRLSAHNVRELTNGDVDLRTSITC